MSLSVADLRHRIRLADANYRNGTPTISDASFDALVAELRSVAPDAPELHLPGGGTSNCGTPMLSLDNGDFETWHANRLSALGTSDLPMVVQPKIDGIALGLRYANGKLVSAWTRSGKPALHVAALVHSIPKQLPADAPQDLEVNGELYGLDFKQSTPAAALRKKVPSGAGLAFLAYRLPASELDEVNAIHLLDRLGFPVPDTLLSTKPTEVVRLHARWKAGDLFRSWPTDGIVVKLLSRTSQSELGCTTVAPRWAHALK
jgi:DNA ligase (NAD+)